MSVSTLIANAKEFANELKGLATTNLAGTGSAVRSLTGAIKSIDYVPPTLPSTPLAVVFEEPPEITLQVLDLPDAPRDLPVFQDISPIDTSGFPTNKAVAPTLIVPTKPNQIATFTAALPAINTNFTFPTVPDALNAPIMPAPTFAQIMMPAAPNMEAKLSAIQFKGQAPSNVPVAPTNLKAEFAFDYQGQASSTINFINGYVDAQLQKINPRFHEQMNRIETQLATYLEGGTALKPSVENAIYERARSRNDAEARRVAAAAFSDMAARGFTLPTGALVSARQQARQAAADNNAVASREIVVMQAEMEQKNLQFAVTTSAALRSTVLNASLAYMQNLISVNSQALEFAKTALNATIEIYNAAIKYFSAQLDLYKAEASVYETQLRAVLAYIEVFKGELQAAELKVNIDRLEVDKHKSQIETLSILANIYRTRIEAVVAQAGLEKVKLDAFELQVKGFEASVQAKNAEWSAFSAELSGEAAKAQIYRTQMDGFSAESAAFRTKIDAQIAVTSAATSVNDARSRLYSANVSAFNAQISAESNKTQANIETSRQVLTAFRSTTDLKLAQAQNDLAVYKTNAQVALDVAQGNFAAKSKTAENDLRKVEIQIKAYDQASVIYGQLAGAALSGMNTLAAEVKNE